MCHVVDENIRAEVLSRRERHVPEKPGVDITSRQLHRKAMLGRRVLETLNDHGVSVDCLQMFELILK